MAPPEGPRSEHNPTSTNGDESHVSVRSERGRAEVEGGGLSGGQSVVARQNMKIEKAPPMSTPWIHCILDQPSRPPGSIVELPYVG